MRSPTRRTCRFRNCRKRFTPQGRGRPMRYCSEECRTLYWAGQRVRKAGIRRKRFNGFVTRARQEVRGRLCLMCQTEPLRGNQRVMCSRPECKRAYNTEHKREQRAHQ